MGVTKFDIYTDNQNKIAAIAKVLGHPARIAILQQLIEIESCICGDLVEEIGLAQPTISQHLKELKNAELIKGDIEGTSVCYCLSEKGIRAISEYLVPLIDNLNVSTIQNCP